MKSRPFSINPPFLSIFPPKNSGEQRVIRPHATGGVLLRHRLQLPLHGKELSLLGGRTRGAMEPESGFLLIYMFFPTCQVRVVRFYQSCRLLLPPPPPPPPSPRLLLPPDLNYSHPRQVLAAGPQPRPSQPSVGCRTPTTASPAQCWLPDLNHGHPSPVLAAGPQPRPAPPSVGCRTSTTTIHAQCSLPDLNSYAKSYAR